MPTFTMELPWTSRTNELESVTISVGRVKVSSTFCSARMGMPAATRPTRGRDTEPRSGMARTSAVLTDVPSCSKTSSARGFVLSRLMSPWSSSAERCAWTVEGEDRPTAAAISRTLGG